MGAREGRNYARKAPNHSWRHRFADQCRRAGVPRDVRFALEGHASSDVGDTYGSDGYPLRILADAVSKLPSPLAGSTEDVEWKSEQLIPPDHRASIEAI